ncbi:MAG: SGNH/GDSL hydrolase family protein [Salinivirgaceae bacterium]
MKLNVLLVSLFLGSLLIGCNIDTKTIPFNNPNIVYQGRVDFKSDAAVFSWPGTSATLYFEGTSVSATLKDLDTANYYNVIVDDSVILKIHTDTIKQRYLLASELSKGIHKIELFKRTEEDKGKTLFYGFESQDGLKIVLPAQIIGTKKRKIEFYGNSITCGYALEDSSSGDSGHGYFENNYLTYAAITARYFDANYSCIAKSGIGILVSWFPIIMPEMYDRLDPTDSTSKWDFNQYTPDVVVINLFQNDSWIVNMPEYEQFKNRFGSTAPDSAIIIAAYKSFVTSIRTKYPNVPIICALGNMDATRIGSPWPGYIQQAITPLNDAKIYTCFFEFKNSPGHPNLKEQQVMADQLIAFIKKELNW